MDDIHLIHLEFHRTACRSFLNEYDEHIDIRLDFWKYLMFRKCEEGYNVYISNDSEFIGIKKLIEEDKEGDE